MVANLLGIESGTKLAELATMLDTVLEVQLADGVKVETQPQLSEKNLKLKELDFTDSQIENLTDSQVENIISNNITSEAFYASKGKPSVKAGGIFAKKIKGKRSIDFRHLTSNNPEQIYNQNSEAIQASYGLTKQQFIDNWNNLTHKERINILKCL